MRFNLFSLPTRPQYSTSAYSGDGIFALAVLLAYAANALLLEPNYERRPVGELLYACMFSVAIGALIGFALFDRYGFRRVGAYIATTVALIAAAALFNEAVVEPVVFDGRPINGEGLYYSVTDIGSAAGIFLVIRLLQLLRRQLGAASVSSPEAGKADWFFVRIASQTRRILASDVLYMKAERDFTHVICASGVYFVSESLKDLLAKSSALGITRVHKSFAVNLRRVDRLTGNGVEVGGHNVPVGRTFRSALAAAWMSEAGEPRRPMVAYG